MSNNSYIHLIDGEISQSSQIHPMNDRNSFNLRDKEVFMKKFIHDISGGGVSQLNGDDDYMFSDISNGNKNMFKFKLDGYLYNIYIEHADGGGRDITFNNTNKKVSIPYANSTFKKLIESMTNVLVMDIYFALKNSINNQLVIDDEKYCYLIVIPSDIYASKGAYDILINVDKPSPSSRWVTLQTIKDCIKTKNTQLNAKKNVWIVHPDNLMDFLSSVVLDDYRNQHIRAYKKILEFAYTRKNTKRFKQLNKARMDLRKKLLYKYKQCEILNCGINEKQLLVASHIWPVNKILSEQDMTWNEKLKHINNENNAFLLCNIHDKLFDRFLISFSDEGVVICSKLIKNSMTSYKLKNNTKYLNVDDKTKPYLLKHREIFAQIESERFVGNE